MNRTIKNILWVMIGIMLLGTAIYAGTGQRMSFEEAKEKKESQQKKATDSNMTKEELLKMPPKERQKYVLQMMQAEEEQEASGNFEYIEREYKKGTLLPPADTSILELGGAKYKKAIPLLIEILKNYHVTDIRVASAEALGNIGDPSAIPSLIEALGYKDYQIKVEAAVALVKLGKPDEAFPVLAQVAKKEDIENWDIDVESRLNYFPANLKEQKRKELIENFRNSSLPSKAIRYLGEIGSEQALDVIEIALNDPDEFVRLRAGYVLMETERKKVAIPVLVKIIDNNNITNSVRSAALFALAKGEGEEERAILKKYSNSNDKYISKEAKEALERIEDKAK